MCLLGDLARKPGHGCSQTNLLTSLDNVFGLVLSPSALPPHLNQAFMTFCDATSMVAAKRRR